MVIIAAGKKFVRFIKLIKRVPKSGTSGRQKWRI